MDDYKCAFSATLIRGEFGCRHAIEVTRRSGPDIACTVEASHRRCAELHAAMKTVGLAAFAMPDDPAATPHSAMIKIQFGGLFGLQRLLETDTAATEVADIDSLIAAAIDHYGEIGRIPCQSLANDITGYSLRRRRR